jgi:hypothetical protein
MMSRPTRSDEDLAEGIARLIRALGKRCAAGDPDSAGLLSYLQAELDDALALSVAGWRRLQFSDSQIGAELGVTKQAVQQRWPRTSIDRQAGLVGQESPA